MDWQWHDLPWKGPRPLLANATCPLKGEGMWEFSNSNPCIWQMAHQPSLQGKSGKVWSEVKKHCSGGYVGAVWGVTYLVTEVWYQTPCLAQQQHLQRGSNRSGLAAILTDGHMCRYPSRCRQVSVLGCFNGNLLWMSLPMTEGKHLSWSHMVYSCRKATGTILDSESSTHTCFQDN